MQFSDLHIHSNFSDGILSPEHIVRYSQDNGIKCISITDHDTIASQYITDMINDKSIIIVPGVEISTEYMNKEIHVLGYFIDIHNECLKSSLDKLRQTRVDRARRIIHKLNEIDINISFDDIKSNLNVDSISIGRPHIAKVLVEKGIVNNSKEAFQQYLIKGRPGYVDRYKMNYKEALGLILNSNGIPVLAHPGEIYKGLSVEQIIKEFKVYGLKGIEVFHPSHTDVQVSCFYNLAKKYSLTITGGSDCHGLLINNHLLIGTVGINETLTNKFLKLKSKHTGGQTK